jgi:hypothetical protein
LLKRVPKKVLSIVRGSLALWISGGFKKVLLVIDDVFFYSLSKMKKKLFNFFSMPLILSLVSCDFLRSRIVPDSRAEWEFIQSVGGIRLGAPERIGAEKWKIPVVCNISGLETVTTPPTAMNSGLVVRNVTHKFEQNKLFISLILNSPSRIDESTAKCPDLVMDQVKPELYEVYYRDEKVAKKIGVLDFR